MQPVPFLRRETSDACGSKSAEGARPPSRPPDHPRAGDITVVSAEELVGAVPCERNRHVPSGQATDEVRGDVRRVRQGLIEHVREVRHQRERVPAVHAQLSVIGTQVASDLTRMGGLVVLGPVEADREGPDLLAGGGLHDRDDSR